MNQNFKKLITESSNVAGFSDKGRVTASVGMSYNIFDFKKSDVDLGFIAISLSKICRYIGHTGNKPEHFYSVAQHSVVMAESILLVTGNPIIAMQALMHDASEAYVGDIISPIKREVSDVIKPIEDNIEKVIFDALEIQYPLDPLVKHVDINICLYELEFMVHVRSNQEVLIKTWEFNKAYEEFINMHKKLKKLIKTYVSKSGI